MIIYDCEIIKAIPGKEPRVPGIEYCDGWDDRANMGISVIGVYDYWESRYRIFLEDNFAEFQALVDNRPIVIGFNNRSFDDRLVSHSGLSIPPEKSYDLLVETWIAAGMSPVFSYPSHIGYSLDALAQANGVGGKTGNGALAPIDWQQGRRGKVIDYCLMDVHLTRGLVDLVLQRGALSHPKKPGGELFVRSPLAEAA